MNLIKILGYVRFLIFSYFYNLINFFLGRRSPHKDKHSGDKSYKATSDESSTGREYTLSQTSPRKAKKNKESTRRKSLPRSPTSQKNQKKSDIDYQTTSLPGSLSRRKSTKTPKCLQSEYAENKNIRY